MLFVSNRRPITGNCSKNRCPNLVSPENRPWGRTQCRFFIWEEISGNHVRFRKVRWKWEKSNMGALMSWPLWGTGAQYSRALCGCTQNAHQNYPPEGQGSERIHPATSFPCWLRIVSGGVNTLAFLGWPVMSEEGLGHRAWNQSTSAAGRLKGIQSTWNRASVWLLQGLHTQMDVGLSVCSATY